MCPVIIVSYLTGFSATLQLNLQSDALEYSCHTSTDHRSRIGSNGRLERASPDVSLVASSVEAATLPELSATGLAFTARA